MAVWEWIKTVLWACMFCIIGGVGLGYFIAQIQMSTAAARDAADFQVRFEKLKEEQDLREYGWEARSKQDLTLNEVSYLLSGVCQLQESQRMFLNDLKEEFEKETLPLRKEIEARYNKVMDEAVERIKKRDEERLKQMEEAGK